MALVLNDRVKETTTSTGTGTINLAGAETGFKTFVTGIGNTNTTYYCIAHQSAAEFEVGIGTVTDASPDTLSRTTIISSSTGSAVNFSAGTKDVFCTLPASKAVFADASDNVGIGTSSPSKKFHVKGDEILLEDPQGGYKLELNADTNPVTITANDNTGANYCGFRLKTNNGGGSPVTAMHVFPSGGAFVGFGTDARNDTQMVISKTPTSATQTTPETILTLSNPCLSTSSDIKVGQGPRLVFEIPDDQSGNKATGAAIAALKEVDSDTNSQTSLAFYTSDDDETLDQKMTILSDGKVGIGTTSPTEKLTVNGNIANTAGDLTIDSAGDIILDADGGNVTFKDGGTAIGDLVNASSDFVIESKVQDKDIIFKGDDGGSTITALTLDMSEAGAATFNDNVTAFSDERLKDNIETIENGLDKVEQLRGVTYTRDEKESIGVIAQEVEKILPEIVLTADDEMGTKSVDYSRLTAVLIEAVKDLSARVKELEGK